MLTRRGIVIGGAAMGALAVSGCTKEVGQIMGFAQRMVAIQQKHGGRIGVSALTTDGNADASASGTLSIQSNDRFAHCSTFKWVLATAVLAQVDAGRLTLDKAIAYTKADLLDHAPATTQNVARGRMSVGDLCAAAVEDSDNTAANLLLPLVGGPAGLTTFVRGIGDATTRFDRTEPDLNSNIANDPRDTTTPAAMAQLLKTVYLGTVLTPGSLVQLKTWMTACKTGLDEIRAGVPTGWTVADKTGRGNGAVNDVAVVWPRGKDGAEKPPVFLAIYTTGGTLDDAGNNQTIADITRLVFDTLSFAENLDSHSSSS